MEGKPNSTRFLELEEKFQELESHLPEGPQKEAISVLHAMIQEASRRPDSASTATGELTLKDIANLYKSAPRMDGKAENEPVPVGIPAPDFELPDANGKLVRLSDFRGRAVVIAFYPLDWSPTCSDQLSLYQAELEEFDKLGAQVIGISVDSIYSHGAWPRSGGSSSHCSPTSTPRVRSRDATTLGASTMDSLSGRSTLSMALESFDTATSHRSFTRSRTSTSCSMCSRRSPRRESRPERGGED